MKNLSKSFFLIFMSLFCNKAVLAQDVLSGIKIFNNFLILDLEVSQNQEITIIGRFEDTDAIYGDTTIEAKGSYNLGIIQLDSLGELMWYKVLYDGSPISYEDMTLGDNGDIYFVGDYQVIMSLDGFNITPPSLVNGQLIWGGNYIIGFSQDGSLKWIRILGGGSIENIYEINNFLYISGSYSNQFGYSGGATLTGGPNNKNFIGKLSTQGQHIWLKNIIARTISGGDYFLFENANDDGYVLCFSARYSVNYDGFNYTTPGNLPELFFLSYDLNDDLVNQFIVQANNGATFEGIFKNGDNLYFSSAYTGIVYCPTDTVYTSSARTRLLGKLNMNTNEVSLENIFHSNEIFSAYLSKNPIYKVEDAIYFGFKPMSGIINVLGQDIQETIDGTANTLLIRINEDLSNFSYINLIPLNQSGGMMVFNNLANNLLVGMTHNSELDILGWNIPNPNPPNQSLLFLITDSLILLDTVGQSVIDTTIIDTLVIDTTIVDTALGIWSNLGTDQLKLSPNPFSNELLLTNGIFLKNYITNLQGTKLKVDRISDNHICNLDNIPVGVYFVEILQGDKRKFIQIIKRE